jgi:hypothetical protein
MVDDLSRLPKRIGQPILTAWTARRTSWTCSRCKARANRVEISTTLIRLYESAAACGLPEIERPATTVSTWWPEILAGITTGITDAAPEGINRAIKTDACCAHGYRDPANQRLRARAAHHPSSPRTPDRPPPAAPTASDDGQNPEARLSSKSEMTTRCANEPCSSGGRTDAAEWSFKRS